MEILLIISANEQYTLCHGPARSIVGQHEGPISLGHDPAGQVQIDQILRATHTKPKYRGNITRTIPFTVRVLFNTVSEAQAYALRYPGLIKRSGTVRFVITNEDESKTVMELRNAVVLPPTIPPVDGVSVTINYRVVGGELVDVN